jgi:hypothetical protein
MILSKFNMDAVCAVNLAMIFLCFKLIFDPVNALKFLLILSVR